MCSLPSLPRPYNQIVVKLAKRFYVSTIAIGKHGPEDKKSRVKNMLVLSILFLFFHHADIYIFPPATSAVFRSTSASTRSHAAQSLFRRWCLFVGYSLSFSLPLRYRSIRCCALAYYSSLPQHEQFLPPKFGIKFRTQNAKRASISFLLQNLTSQS